MKNCLTSSNSVINATTIIAPRQHCLTNKPKLFNLLIEKNILKFLFYRRKTPKQWPDRFNNNYNQYD